MVDLQRDLVAIRVGDGGDGAVQGDDRFPEAAPVLDVAGRSCSKLVEAVLKLPLAKTEQVSNWDRRPLRPQQLAYAALDAEVRVRVAGLIAKPAAMVALTSPTGAAARAF